MTKAQITPGVYYTKIPRAQADSDKSLIAHASIHEGKLNGKCGGRGLQQALRVKTWRLEARKVETLVQNQSEVPISRHRCNVHI